MKTTVYVALERLIDMTEASNWKLNTDLAESLRSHRSECSFVAAFAPHRFGLIFESRDEVNEAWNYIHGWLEKRGLKFEAQCVTLKSDSDTTEFVQKDALWLASNSDKVEDSCGIKIVDSLPESVSISQRLKNMVAAILF